MPYFRKRLCYHDVVPEAQALRPRADRL